MSRIIKFVTVVLFFSFIYFYRLHFEYTKKVLSIVKPDFNYFNSVIFKKASSSIEIKKILQNTPYLWRKSGRNSSQQIEIQKLWIKKLSSANFMKTVKPKNILVYDEISLYYGTKGRVQCPYADFEDKCVLVSLPSESLKTNASALLKFIAENRIDAVTKIGKGEPKQQPLLPLLPKNVKQILYIWEPPHIAKFADIGRNNAIVASYSRESDILTPYRRWIEYPEGSPEISNRMNNFDGILESKTKMAVAVISNCNRTLNNRLEFISELQKYIDVDVYGKCGNFSCSKTNHHECMSMFEKDYKFYLALENSNCVDYITEKYFNNGLNYNIVPVVMGAPLDTYKEVGPPNSFIHVEEFKSPKTLAKYLHKVSKNETLYEKYLEYKDTGYVSNESHEDFFCRVCGMLYYSDYVPPPKWDSNVTMWKDVNYCLPQGEYYWNDGKLF